MENNTNGLCNNKIPSCQYTEYILDTVRDEPKYVLDYLTEFHNNMPKE